jgi:hypothetical protein
MKNEITQVINSIIIEKLISKYSSYDNFETGLINSNGEYLRQFDEDKDNYFEVTILQIRKLLGNRVSYFYKYNYLKNYGIDIIVKRLRYYQDISMFTVLDRIREKIKYSISRVL